MDVRSHLHTSRPRHDVLAWVDDLGRYPDWMRLVHTVESLAPDERGPAWRVELRARLGPFARSKRLRMVRTQHQSHQVVFERIEDDDRQHSPWVLTLDLADRGEQGGGTDLEVTLHYGGSLWTGGVLERVLADEVDRGRDRLLSLLRER